MQIIIPMSGSGERFIQAGYTAIKPLIPVHGKPIIEWVVQLFPQEAEFIFICRDEHLQQKNLAEVLQRIAPQGRIVPIAAHKLGPVHAVLQAADSFNMAAPAIVNYCDFYMHWNYSNFKKMVTETGADGAIPCYTGFHPHLLHQKNVYAACRVNAQLDLLEIQEKCRFEKDPFRDHHSVGTYYFKSGGLMVDYMQKLVTAQQHLNGEYYVSMVYEEMLADGKAIKVYNDISHFCQWGTPGDLEEYMWWSELFNNKQ